MPVASLILDQEMFAAAAMESKTGVSFEAMEVAQLKELRGARYAPPGSDQYHFW